MAPRQRGFPGALAALPVLAVLLAVLLAWAAPARGMELCGEQSKSLMRSVGISEAQIAELCKKALEASRLTRLTIRRREDEAGYCRVTLALRNDSIHHINSFLLTTDRARFEIFKFYDIIPGRTGFASGLSRNLMECSELGEIGVVLVWPGSVRVDDRPLSGRLLDQYKPALLSKELRWKE